MTAHTAYGALAPQRDALSLFRDKERAKENTPKGLGPFGNPRFGSLGGAGANASLKGIVREIFAAVAEIPHRLLQAGEGFWRHLRRASRWCRKMRSKGGVRCSPAGASRAAGGCFGSFASVGRGLVSRRFVWRYAFVAGSRGRSPRYLLRK